MNTSIRRSELIQDQSASSILTFYYKSDNKKINPILPLFSIQYMCRRIWVLSLILGHCQSQKQKKRFKKIRISQLKKHGQLWKCTCKTFSVINQKYGMEKV